MNLKEGLNNVFLYGHRLGLKKSNEMGLKSMFSKGKQTITNGLFLHIFIIYKHNGHQFDMVGCTRVHYSYYMYKLWLFIRFWLLKLKKLDQINSLCQKKSVIDFPNPIRKKSPWPISLKEGLNNALQYAYKFESIKIEEMS